MEEGEEAATVAGAVDVEEVAVAPVVLEVGWGGETEFGVLGSAVVVPGSGYAVYNGDVKGEVEGGDGVGWEGLVVVSAGERRMRKKEGEGRRMYVCGEIVGEMDGALATHSLPGALPGDAFGGGAAPEKGVFFFREWGI